jgi:hypothetical protein
MSTIIIALTAVMISAYAMVTNRLASMIADLPIGAAITAGIAGVVRTAMTTPRAAAIATTVSATMTTPHFHRRDHHRLPSHVQN